MTQYTILLYHGVHDDALVPGHRNRSGKHVPARRFRAEMQHLKTHFPVVSMAQIADAHYGRASLPDKAVAITFDDGFLNNYETAWPVLEELEIPATFYLATGFIGSGRMVWSDRLEVAFLGTRRDRLDIEAAGRRLVYPLRTDEERIAAFLEVKAFCKSLAFADVETVVSAVETALAAEEACDHPLYAFMTWDDVRAMNRSPLVSFGAHTVDHVSLARVPELTMRRQIDDSVATLARELDEEVRLFSYPEGMEGDFNSAVIAHLVASGFDHCPTAIAGFNTLETDPYHLRRIMVGFEGRAYPFAAAQELEYVS